jgi:hypothetical protein
MIWAFIKFDLRYGHQLVLNMPKYHFTSKEGLNEKKLHLHNAKSKEIQWLQGEAYLKKIIFP